MLIRRATVLKRANGKIQLARDLLASAYQAGDRWIVYCDFTEQLTAVLTSLRDAGLPSYEYHSSMNSARAETMDYFSRHGGIMVAIRCLDEGVDIPTVNRA